MTEYKQTGHQGMQTNDEQHQSVLQRARALWQTTEIEIDDNARVSVGDVGVWVQAWVWVPDDEVSM